MGPSASSSSSPPVLEDPLSNLPSADLIRIYRKSEGTCEQGQTAAQTGCTPASGDGGEGKAPSEEGDSSSRLSEALSRWFEAETFDEIKKASKEGKGTPQAMEYARILQEAAEVTDSGKIMLSRGLYLSEGDESTSTWEQGSEIILDSLTSASSDLTTSIAFSNPTYRGLPKGGTRVLLKYNNPRGLRGVKNPHMEEVVMPKGARFRISKVEKQSGTGLLVINLEEEPALPQVDPSPLKKSADLFQEPSPGSINRARNTDLITLPEGVKGTNCGNCMYVQEGYCIHPEVDQPVTERMCCALWDHSEAIRSWEGEKSFHWERKEICSPGQRSDLTGCTPASGETQGNPPSSEESESEGSYDLEEIGSMTWDALKQAGRDISAIEHSAKEWVSSGVQRRVQKLPPSMQKVVKGAWVAIRMGTKAAFATYIAGQKLAEDIAKERGNTIEEASRLRAILSTIDLAAFKPVSIGVGVLAGPIPAAVGSFAPIGSLTYVAYSFTRNPIKVIQAAAKTIKGLVSRKKGMEGADGEQWANEMWDWVSQEDTEWRTALLLAALDQTQDPSQALKIAQQASGGKKSNGSNMKPSPFRKDMSAYSELSGGGLIPPSLRRKKSLFWITKDTGGSCEQGETAAQTGCIPASGDGTKKPQAPSVESSASVREGFTSIQRTQDGRYIDRDGNPLSEEMASRVKKLRLPPAWKDVVLSEDPKAPLQALGKDVKGRAQYVYSEQHWKEAAREKFQRMKKFVKELPKITKKLNKELQAEEDTVQKEAAAVLLLMRKTGFRIGSERDTQTEHEALGATTLTDENVQIEGDTIKFDFIGKKGVKIEQEIEDPELVNLLSPRLGKGKLFNATDVQVRDYLHSISKGFKPKDMRTVVAAETALEAIKGIKAPKTEKEFKKARTEVGKIVSQKLGNTPSVALASYIPPEVFSSWQANLKSESKEKFLRTWSTY